MLLKMNKKKIYQLLYFVNLMLVIMNICIMNQNGLIIIKKEELICYYGIIEDIVKVKDYQIQKIYKEMQNQFMIL